MIADLSVLQLLEEDYAWLLTAIDRADRSHGGTFIVAGPEGSGVTELLDGLTDEALRKRHGPKVVRGTIEAGTYVAAARNAENFRRALDLVTGIIAVTSPLWGVAALAAQVIAQSQGAETAFRTLTRRKTPMHTLEIVPRVLRAAAKESPLLCVIDDPDVSADDWWTDLLLTFSGRLATDVPLVLVLGLNSEEAPHRSAGPSIAGMAAAQELTAAGLAERHDVARVADSKVAQAIGPCDPRVPQAACEIADRRAGWVVETWADWREEGVLVERSGLCVFAKSYEARVFDSASDHFAHRLRRSTGLAEASELSQIMHVLGIGALQGRVFTREAVRRVLMQEGKAAEQLFDGRLLTAHDNNESMLIAHEPVVVRDEGGTRELLELAFRRRHDWLIARQLGLPNPDTRRRLAGDLAEALLLVYGGDSFRMADHISRLLAEAGSAESAEQFRRAAALASDRDLVVWRARQALSVAQPSSVAEGNRLAELLIAGAAALYTSGPWQLGEKFGQRAEVLASAGSLKSGALYYAAWFHAQLEKNELATRKLKQALAVCPADMKNHRASIQHQQANQALHAGRLTEAIQAYEDVIELRRQLKDVVLEARAFEALGDVYVELEDYEKAEEHLNHALQLSARAGEEEGLATTLRRLGNLAVLRGQLAEARRFISESLEILRRHGDRRDVVAALDTLVAIALTENQFDEAKAAAEAMRQLAQQIGDAMYLARAEARLKEVRTARQRRRRQ